MASFEEIDRARQTLGLGRDATLKEIRQHFRERAHQYHPDKCRDEEKARCEETMKELNRAYDLILRYCADYRYPFREEDVSRTYPYDEYLSRWRRRASSDFGP